MEELAVEDEQVAVPRSTRALRARLACDEAKLPEAVALPRHPKQLCALPRNTAAARPLRECVRAVRARIYPVLRACVSRASGRTRPELGGRTRPGLR